MKNKVTRKMVNDALRERGRDESLREGEGYFYFGGGGEDGEAVGVSEVEVRSVVIEPAFSVKWRRPGHP
jgi:hypothetical protein